MDRLFEIASRISTPLALSGLLAAAFFLIARQIISKNVFPILTKQISAHLLKLIIERLFILSLVAMVLGFAGFVLTEALKARSVDKGKLEIGQFLVGKDVKGKFIEVMVNNTTDRDAVLSKFVYARGVSSAEMDLIDQCCVYCMEAWYAVRRGPATIATPGTRIAQTISFVKTEESGRSFRGRVFYAPGCEAPLFAQLEMNISVVVAAKHVIKVGVFLPDATDDKVETNTAQGAYITKDVLAEKDQVCVYVGVESNPLALKACRPESDVGERFF